MMKLFVDDEVTNKGLVVKLDSYSNNSVGITEPQRRILKAMASGKGNFLKEVTKGNKRIVYRCIDRNRNPIGTNFHKVVVKNLVSKGYLIEHNKKFYLK